MGAVLRRVGEADRPCIVFITDWTVQELYARAYDPLSRRALVSVEGLSLAPNFQLDRLVTFAQPVTNPPVEFETLRIMSPATQIGPAGVTLLWELVVRK